ncbi:hypothetical protein C7B62_08065 [Pleurocapsa sp. CCALA 161]|uniref:hypothetical protein n=1 Tax=Pleurocapsa sp. CCALA 161 TaxID=2107688 RepID=UPI000D0649E8|nr:hypothetical protein [Pleurocapsa sp. CCALA 161]PSB10759.1 hypothetical protein C7B62_08065 [Pleurocapsa sp. CCALA 161]
MDNPIIQTDLAQVLNRLDGKFDSFEAKFDRKFDSLEAKFDQKIDKLGEKIDKLDDNIGKLEVGQVEIKGNIKVLEAQSDQLDKRIGNVEFASRGILIGISVIVLGGFAMFFGMANKF